MIFRIVLIFLLIGFTHSAYGAWTQTSDTFNVDFQVGAPDTTPPSTPANLTADPVTQTQIDLSWDASVDDVLLSGYQVFRDAALIATTTLTTYSDTGLAASTSYTYFVRAFDSSLNISSSSNSVTTTTLQAAPTSTPPVDDGGSSGNSFLQLVSLTVTPSVFNVDMQWETRQYAQYELRWGRTSSYELGYVANDVFRKEHRTVITGLEPGTTYEYELRGYDHSGRMTVLSRDQFTTLSPPDTTAPANVTNLQAVVDGFDVLLSWDNPSDDDFGYVRILRNPFFYPTDPYDGYLVYQGDGTYVLDENAVRTEGTRYYTVFVYDQNGNVSSGAIVHATRYDSPPVEDGETATSTYQLNITIQDVELIQNAERIFPDARGNFEISSRKPFTLRIPYEKLPEHLKTIRVTLVHPDDPSRVFSFLLRVNRDKTAYEARIGALNDEGVYPAQFTIFDFEAKTMVAFDGTLTAVAPVMVMPSFTSIDFWAYLFLLILLLLLLLLLWYVRKIIVERKKRELV